MEGQEAKLAGLLADLAARKPRAVARAITLVEEGGPGCDAVLRALDQKAIQAATVIGVTGPPGAGKSSLSARLVGLLRARGERVGIVAVDPSSVLSGGALLGDRIRMMAHATDADVLIRSMASRGRLGGLCGAAAGAARVMAGAGCSFVFLETVGVGQSEMDIVRLADLTVMVLAPGLGDEVQAMKAGLLEMVDLLVVNKADLAGAEGLALDLEGAARDRQRLHGQAPPPVCMASALEERGIAELLAKVEELAGRRRASGELESRRLDARRLEILDWALEFLRPRLAGQLTKPGVDAGGDPRQAARRLLAGLFSEEDGITGRETEGGKRP